MNIEARLEAFYKNKALIKMLTEENDEILDDLGFRQTDPGSYSFNKYKVEVSENVRFDSDLASELYPPTEDNLKLYTVKVDATLAKKHLSPEQYKAAQKVYPNNKVEVKLNG